ncbi:MAG: hypothetical protein ABIA93_04770 [Candidatus Woesearchaeota archaeon]
MRERSLKIKPIRFRGETTGWLPGLEERIYELSGFKAISNLYLDEVYLGPAGIDYCRQNFKSLPRPKSNILDADTMSFENVPSHTIDENGLFILSGHLWEATEVNYLCRTAGSFRGIIVVLWNDFDALGRPKTLVERVDVTYTPGTQS